MTPAPAAAPCAANATSTSIVSILDVKLRRSQERWQLVQQALRIIERHVEACAILDTRPHTIERAAVIERELDELIKGLDKETSRLTLELAHHDYTRKRKLKHK